MTGARQAAPRQSRWNINLDRYLNPFLPPPPRHALPKSVLRPLGIHNRAARPANDLVSLILCFVGVLVALSLVSLVGRQIPLADVQQRPIILGSFGAAVVLEFYAIDSPLAQPRNLVFGQLSSSIIGIGIRKGFALLPPPYDQDLRWLAGALACATSTVFMGVTGTTHPPAGATTLLAVTDDSVAGLGWGLVLVVLMCCLVTLIIAMLINNIHRRFPTHWWTADKVGSFWARPSSELNDLRDEEWNLERETMAKKVQSDRAERRHSFGATVSVSEHGIEAPLHVYTAPR